MKPSIALIGMPRSGTTWVAKAIDSHPDVHYLHEPDTIQKIATPICIPENETVIYRQEIVDFMGSLEGINHSRCVGKLPLYQKSYRNLLQHFIQKLVIYGQKVAERANLELLKENVPILGRINSSKLFWKSIESMGRAVSLAENCPESKFVILLRHPCAIYASVKRGVAKSKYSSSTPIYENWGLFEELIQGTYAKEQGITIEKLTEMSVAQRMAWRWLMFIEDIERRAQTQDNCYVVKYEDICADPNKHFGKILSFYELSFDQQVQNYIVETTSSSEDDFYSINKDPLVSAQKWKAELSEVEVTEMMDIIMQSQSGKKYL